MPEDTNQGTGPRESQEKPSRGIVVIGEILVEIMADTVGDGFRAPIGLTGPFPSGAPAIFIDQVARMGSPCAIISAVGDDDFGRINTERLAADGVDIAGIAIDRDRPTGSAFVRYRADGSRDFIFNIRHAACGRVQLTSAAEAILAVASHLHVMGSSLSSPDFVALNLDVARAVKARGGTVSFDPNVRKEMLAVPGLRAAMEDILRLTDLFLPSGDELTLLCDAASEREAIADLLRGGVTAIVHKRGRDGARYHDVRRTVSQAAFAVDEVDPTGAGDCFGGVFTALWLQGAPPDEALLYAAGAGACAVTRRGPMEGTANRTELARFIAHHRSGPESGA